MVLVFKYVGERYITKNYRLVSILSVVSKAFSDFQYVFRSSRSTADLTVTSDRIAGAFNMSGAT